MQIQTITVIGANGNMGRKVAGVFAALGGARVYMVSRELEASCQAIGHAAQSVRDESVQMIPADYSALAECLGKSDLVFESVAEDLTVKRDLLRKMIPYIRKDCILCTGGWCRIVHALAGAPCTGGSACVCVSYGCDARD